MGRLSTARLVVHFVTILGVLAILSLASACGDDDKFAGTWRIEQWQVAHEGDAAWMYPTPPSTVVLTFMPDSIPGFLAGGPYDGWGYSDGVFDVLLSGGAKDGSGRLDGATTDSNGTTGWDVIVSIDYYSDPEEVRILRIVARPDYDPTALTEWDAYLRPTDQ
jgi:hypothetical protein